MTQRIAIAVLKGKNVEETDGEISRTIDRTFPEIRGWAREVVVGGVLCNACVTYHRETDMFAGTIVAFISLADRGSHSLMTYDVTAYLGEKLPGDDCYYSFDGSFLRNLGTVRNARLELKKLAGERRAAAGDFN